MLIDGKVKSRISFDNLKEQAIYSEEELANVFRLIII